VKYLNTSSIKKIFKYISYLLEIKLQGVQKTLVKRIRQRQLVSLSHVMKRHSLKNLAPRWLKTLKRKAKSVRDWSIWINLCESWKDNVSPTQLAATHQGFRGQSALASHGLYNFVKTARQHNNNKRVGLTLTTSYLRVFLLLKCLVYLYCITMGFSIVNTHPNFKL